MKFLSLFCDSYDYVRRRIYLILWISLVLYLFYNTFIYYETGRQFRYLRRLLGVGICISRATATVINLCGALILLPLCKKLNQLWYRILSRLWPRLFFFWLEKAKSFHITVAITLLFFAVVHSISHLVNLWNFSRGYDPMYAEINFANYRDENPLILLLSLPGVTGVSMVIIVLLMGLASLRVVRRRMYHVFWGTHQLYFVFILLFIIHPLSGVLKEEVLQDEASQNVRHNINTPRFAPIQSKTCAWMFVPLALYFCDLMWRIFTRNTAKFRIIEVNQMSGRTLSLTISCPHFSCRPGQYVLLQCLDVSVIEWHPFTVVKIPTSYQRSFVVWIRVKGDWTEALQKLLLETGLHNIRILVDGPFSSPMEDVCRSGVAVCVAAGVGVTPFVPVLHDMLLNPRKSFPDRLHLIWIVRNEQELKWLADLATNTMLQLRNANRPDKLHLEFYVTDNSINNNDIKNETPTTKMMVVNEKGLASITNDEKVLLLTPNLNRNERNVRDVNYNIAKEYPLLGCRVRRGRPHWDKVFGYWVHLYPKYHLNFYCCGPKKLVKVLRKQCEIATKTSRTHFTFVHEGFS